MSEQQRDLALAQQAKDVIAVIEEQGDFRVYKLALEWPSLAAALGELMETAETVLPAPLRHAMIAVREGVRPAINRPQSERGVEGPLLDDRTLGYRWSE